MMNLIHYKERCTKCKKSKEDYSDLPFPENWSLNDEGVCSICEGTFERYKKKKLLNLKK